MPQLIRLYITQSIIGFGLSAVLVALLLWFNVANLWHLVTHTEAGLLAVFMLWLFNGIVFAGAQFAIAIMGMADDDDTPRGGRRQRRDYGQMIPIRVEARANTQRRRY